METSNYIIIKISNQLNNLKSLSIKCKNIHFPYLVIKLNTLKLNPVYDECKNMIMEAQENVTKIESLERNAESYIYEYFEDIKRKVDLRREDLKMKIDTCSDELIKSIESNQLNCFKLSKEVDLLTSDIEKFKQELNELVDRFDT